MRNKLVNFIVAIAAVAAAGGVAAQHTIGDLSKIQSETLILKAQVSRATAQAELVSKTQTASASAGQSDELPMVRSVAGVGGKRAAIFVYTSGSTKEAVVDDVIPGGYKVVSIAVDGVTVSKGGRTFSVSFVSSGYTSGYSSAPAPIPTMR